LHNYYGIVGTSFEILAFGCLVVAVTGAHVSLVVEVVVVVVTSLSLLVTAAVVVSVVASAVAASAGAGLILSSHGSFRG
jgi:hypothetical protein